MSEGRPRLRLVGIGKRFDSVEALDGVDLVVAPGEVRALLGENGAGKTTLMHIAYGLVRADRGRVECDGMPVAIRSPRDARAQGIGMVHQHSTAIPRLSVGENIALVAGWRVRPREIRARVHELCSRLGLPLDPDARVEDLPVALKQRLEIVKALATDTRVLLLDEPTAVLTPEEVDDLVAFMGRFAAGGGSVVLITHKLREALVGADTVTVLRAGRVTCDGPVAAQTTESLVRHMIGSAGPEPLEEAGGRRSGAPAGGRRRPVGAGELVVRATHLARAAGRGQGSGLVDGTLEVGRGEIVGLAAVEGNGQRELLRVIAGVWRPDVGDLEVRGVPGFVPEDRTTEGLIPAMTVTENVVLGAGAGAGAGPGAPWIGRKWPHFIDWRAAGESGARLLERYGVRVGSAGAATPVGALSGGNQQKLVIGRALLGNRSVIVAENPTRGLDVRSAAAVHDRLRTATAAAAGVGVVFYSSDLDEVLELADRVVVLSRGRTIEAGPASDLSRGRLGCLMLGAGGRETSR